jgi:hypothetical protein
MPCPPVSYIFLTVTSFQEKTLDLKDVPLPSNFGTFENEMT